MFTIYCQQILVAIFMGYLHITLACFYWCTFWWCWSITINGMLYRVLQLYMCTAIIHVYCNYTCVLQLYMCTAIIHVYCRQFKSVSLPIYKSSSYRGVPRLCFVATVANQPVVAPYLFCNYKHRPSKLRERRSNYQQKCDIECWEAIMASTAAPGFFEEVKLGPYVFMVGLKVLYHRQCQYTQANEYHFDGANSI